VRDTGQVGHVLRRLLCVMLNLPDRAERTTAESDLLPTSLLVVR